MSVNFSTFSEFSSIYFISPKLPIRRESEFQAWGKPSFVPDGTKKIQKTNYSENDTKKTGNMAFSAFLL
jgi:hypothetical protein